MCYSVIFWRWAELVLLWTLGLGVLILGHPPSLTAAADPNAIAQLANLQGALVLVLLAGASFIFALYGLLIVTPMWLLAELLAWRKKPAVQRVADSYDSAGDYQRVKHGWIPR